MASAVVFLAAASPIVSVAAAKVSRSRERMTVPKQIHVAVREPGTAEELKQLSELLVGLQASQSALEKQTADFNAAIQRRINQLSSEFEDSQKETRQMLVQTNQRINSTQRWCKFIVLMFLLSLGGLLYVARQLPKLQNPVKWKGGVPEVSRDEEGIIAWRSGEPANGPARTPDIKSDTRLSPPPR
jgi:hypothetical protein